MSDEKEMAASRIRMAYNMIVNATYLLEDDGNPEACAYLSLAIAKLEERHGFDSPDDMTSGKGSHLSH